MMNLNLKSNEGRALAVILTIMGEFGRSEFRKHILSDLNRFGTDAKHTLDVMNIFERAFDKLKKGKES